MDANATAALDTYDFTLKKLSATMPNSVAKAPRDPSFSGKGGNSIAKIRVLPIDRTPISFWSSTWCFYEIGVGLYNTGRANFGAVQFVMYPDNKQCGEGRYRHSVAGILKGMNPSGKKGFFLNLRGGATGAAILCGFQYNLGDFKAFSPDIASEDLAWLIKSTLKPFSSLK